MSGFDPRLLPLRDLVKVHNALAPGLLKDRFAAIIRQTRDIEQLEARDRSRRGLDELWPAALPAALDFLGLEAKTAGRVIRVRCPRCGQRRGYLYRDMAAPRVVCNRRNACRLDARVFDLLEERIGSKADVLAQLREWAGEGVS